MEALNFNTPVRSDNGDIKELRDFSGGASTSVILETDENKRIRFGIDEHGNWGFIKDGADTVTPFSMGSASILNFIPTSKEFGMAFEYPGDGTIISRYSAPAQAIGLIFSARVDLTNFNSITIVYKSNSYFSTAFPIEFGIIKNGFFTNLPSRTTETVKYLQDDCVTGDDKNLTLDTSDLTGEYSLGIATSGANVILKKLIVN
ncbi:MAG: hypothetical protein MJZ34_14625 [Paludibacteraceae bacterium]|nr:hypothetical protein [Paludibacteraceae bacterium]